MLRPTPKFPVIPFVAWMQEWQLRNEKNLPRRYEMTTCDRCNQPTSVTIMSKFNRDILCSPCKADERAAPNYKVAEEAESAAVRRGDYNFPGIGLAPEDRAFLAERRKTRAA